MELVVFVVFLGLMIANASFTSTVAKAKGYNGGSWFVGGLFFGLFALIAIAGMPLAKDNKELERIATMKEQWAARKKLRQASNDKKELERVNALQDQWAEKRK